MGAIGTLLKVGVGAVAAAGTGILCYNYGKGIGRQEGEEESLARLTEASFSRYGERDREYMCPRYSPAPLMPYQGNYMCGFY